MLITRHGGGSHYVRPDGVMRTGVLTSIWGFQPDADVQSVARAFVQGPPSGTIWASGGTTLVPLAGLSGPNFFQRIGLRIQAAFANARAKKFMAMNGGVVPGYSPSPSGPAYTEAQIVAPQMQAQMQMLARLAPTEGGGSMAAAYAAATRRLNTYYRAG